MDYNDIKFRLQRTLESLKGRFNDDIDNHTHYDFYEHKGEQRASMTFGTTDEKKLINPIMIILHNLASLKDNLKKCMKDNGHKPEIVEEEINNSLHLQILIDIVNQEKHGTPLKKSRSGREPAIKEPSQSFRMASAIRGESGEIISTDGPPTMFIDAYIRDNKGKLIFRLDELVETSYNKFLTLAKMYGCAL